jgi:ribonuclease E
VAEAQPEEAPKKPRRGGRRKKAEEAVEEPSRPAAANDGELPPAPEAPVIERRAEEPAEAGLEGETAGPPRRGWWQRTFGG